VYKVKTEYAQFWKEEGILYCTFSEKLDVDLHIAKACVRERINFSEGISYPCLIDMTNVRSVNKEAREYMAKEGSQLIKAGALITKSSLARMIGNIFLAINKPAIPTKLFSEENAAIAWLKKYIV
jgi:hypothetical protein